MKEKHKVFHGVISEWFDSAYVEEPMTAVLTVGLSNVK